MTRGNREARLADLFVTLADTLVGGYDIVELLQTLAEECASLLDVADAGIVSSWGGYVDSTPDAVPVISPVDSIGGVFVAAGCSGHGFGAGPGIGHLAADLVAADAASVDPTSFRLSRFTDRSKMEVGAI